MEKMVSTKQWTMLSEVTNVIYPNYRWAKVKAIKQTHMIACIRVLFWPHWRWPFGLKNSLAVSCHKKQGVMEILHEAPVQERKSFESPEQLLLTADEVGLLQVLVLFCNPAPQVDEQAVHADQYVHPISPAKEWHVVRYFGAFSYYNSF